MAVVKSTQEEQDVTFMTDPHPQFVSLVERGANKKPWTVVKTQKESGGNSMAKRVLQAVIVPQGTDVEVIKTVLGDEVKLDTVKTAGSVDSYEQIPRTVCKADSFELVELDAEKGIRGLAAELVEESEPGFVMKLLKPRAPKVQAMELDDSIQPVEKAELAESLRQGISDEVWRMESATFGILGQKMGDAGEKLNAIKMVVNNMMMYIEEAFSVSKFDASEPIDILDGGLQSIAQLAEKVGKKISSSRIALLKSAHEALTKILAEVEVEAGVEKKDPTSIMEEINDMNAEDTQKMINEAIAPLMETLTALKTATDSLAETSAATLTALKTDIAAMQAGVEKMQKSIPTVVASKESETVTPEQKPVQKTQQEKDREVFKGSLFKVA